MIVNNNINNIKISGLQQKVDTKKVDKPLEQGFDRILNDTIAKNSDNDVKFSKHAEQRLKTRNIELTGQQKDRLSDGVNMAKEKGIKDSLLLCDNMAFVVNVKNRTVITALNGTEMKNNVFTNIDGAVIV